jgi:single-strand DNA-binding protein
MAGYNRIVMIGNLTRDPEMKQLPSGQSVCRLGIASNRPYKNRQTGAQQQEVCFVDVDVWGAQAETCGQYLQKGRSVLVEGRLKLDTWQDPQGGTRSKHSIVADRIVFLSANEAAGNDSYQPRDSSSDTSSFGSEGTEKFSQVAAEIAKKKSTKKASGFQVDPTAINFKDDAPFEDELPF